MANLTESAVYEAGIYQLETTDPVIGGASGISNLQAKQLANRTKFLYDELVTAGVGSQALDFSGDLDDLKGPAFVLVHSTATNKPISGVGHLIVTGRQSVAEVGDVPAAAQLFLSQQVNRMYFRFAAGTSWTSWYGLQTTTAATTFQTQFSGMVAHFGTATAPSGWLPCNGAAVSRTTYSTLFGRLGTTFGTGNGSTTFNLPDLRGEFIRGFDDGRGVDSGRTFGTAQAGQADAASHSHSYGRLSIAATRYINDLGSGGGGVAVHNVSEDAASTSGTSTLAGHPRNVALLACIKY